MCLSSWHHCEISQPFICTFVPNTRGHARPCVCLADIIVKFLSPSSVLSYQILEVMSDGLGMRQTVWNMRNLRHKPVRVWTVPCTSTGRIARTHHWSWGGEKKESCKNKASYTAVRWLQLSLIFSYKHILWYKTFGVRKLSGFKMRTGAHQPHYMLVPVTVWTSKHQKCKLTGPQHGGLRYTHQLKVTLPHTQLCLGSTTHTRLHTPEEGGRCSDNLDALITFQGQE